MGPSGAFALIRHRSANDLRLTRSIENARQRLLIFEIALVKSSVTNIKEIVFSTWTGIVPLRFIPFSVGSRDSLVVGVTRFEKRREPKTQIFRVAERSAGTFWFVRVQGDRNGEGNLIFGLEQSVVRNFRFFVNILLFDIRKQTTPIVSRVAIGAKSLAIDRDIAGQGFEATLRLMYGQSNLFQVVLTLYPVEGFADSYCRADKQACQDANDGSDDQWFN